VKKTAIIVMVAFALAVSACADGDSIADEFTSSPSLAEAGSTTLPESTTSFATGTTTAASTDTTTTTVAVATEASEADALFASIKTDADITSGRVEGTIEMSGLPEQEGSPSEVTMVFSTAFNAATGDSSMLMDTSSMAEAMPADPDDPFAVFAHGLLGEMEFRQVGDRAYARGGFFGLMLGSETAWISMPADDGADFEAGFESAPTDPHDVLASYEGAAATVENLGDESVNGLRATHYRVLVDATKLMEERSPDEVAEFAQSGLPVIGDLPIELWITEEGYLVRMNLEIDGSGAESIDGQFETMKLTFDMYDINGPVTIEKPPAGDVTPIEELDIGSFDLGVTGADV